MASKLVETPLACPAAHAWALLADTAAPHKAFPGVLTGARLEGEARVVTVANGAEVYERIVGVGVGVGVGVDAGRRRLAYTVLGGRFTQHGATMQIVPNGERCRFVWWSDFLPDEAAPLVEGLMKQGSAAFASVVADPS